MATTEAPPATSGSSNNAFVIARPAGPQGADENVAGDAIVSRGVKRKAVEEAGGSDSGDASNTLFMDLQMRVKTLEVEMERMKEDHIQLLGRKQAANDDAGADEAATPPETRAVVSTARSPADPAAASCPAAARHISSLGDDLLLEIFLLLPSLATLVRAACTCPAWRRLVASSPTFRRRFSAHHPPPFLGFFFQIPRTIAPNVPAFPTFVPARTRDRDAAIRGGDFFLTSLQGRHPADDHELLSWEIMDGSHGYALLVNGNAKTLAVFNLVTRHTDRVFDIVSLDSYGTYPGLIGVLLWADEDSMSYRVVLTAQEDNKRIRLIVFSSDTGLWSVTPFVNFPERPEGQARMQANGFLHWFYQNQKNERCMMSLDIDTMEFSVAELPQCLRARGRSLDIGRTKDGTTCIVYADKFSIGVCLMHKGDGNGVDRWEVDRVVPMPTELQQVLPAVHFGKNSELNILEVCNGYVYLATSRMHHQPDTPCWFMTLCMETIELEVLFRRTFDNFVHPYTMAWPPSLIDNNH